MTDGRWIRRVSKIEPAQHRCPAPVTEDWDADGHVGDIWECNTCHKQWKITQIRSEYGVSSAWRRKWWKIKNYDGPLG